MRATTKQLLLLDQLRYLRQRNIELHRNLDVRLSIRGITLSVDANIFHRTIAVVEPAHHSQVLNNRFIGQRVINYSHDELLLRG